MKTSLDSRKRRHNGRRSSAEERRSAKPCQPRVRIPPRPPGAHMPHRCQKWESPNLSKAYSRQRPPAGIEPCPAVIWDSSEDISRQLKSCCKAMRHKPCWRSAHLMKRQMLVRIRPVPPAPKPCVVHGSGLMPCPDGSIRLTHTSITPRIGTPERRGRGGRNPATSPKAEQCAMRVW